nr:hypothetical protein [Rhodospirillales bacterium]
MAYRLALDIGANSIGWCLLDPDGSDPPAPCAIRDIGVRVFPDSRDPQTRASLAAERRHARAMRRRDHYLQRRDALLQALTRHGLMPADADARAAVAQLCPYALRAEALRRRLAPHELGRAVFHLNQRRGFRSNRKTDRGNQEDSGKIQDAARRLATELARGGHVTVGEWLAQRHAQRAEVRARLHGVGAKAAYPFYPTRALIEAEFDTIWRAQSGWNRALAPEIGAELRRIMLFQRPLRDPPVGRCWLEPQQPRAPRALPSTQAFRIGQDLAQLAIRRAGKAERIALPDGHAARSTRAMRRILPHLHDGLPYGAAVGAAGYAQHSDGSDGVILPALPYYGEVPGERLGTGSGAANDPPERRFGRVPNPTVHVAPEWPAIQARTKLLPAAKAWRF